jgi:hypothetical protein
VADLTFLPALQAATFNLGLQRGGVRPLADYIFAMNRNKRSGMNIVARTPPFLKWKK